MTSAGHHSMMQKEASLPYAREAEYLQASGTQYLDSGIRAYSDSNAEIGIELLSTSEIAFFGSSTSADRFVLRSLAGNLSFGYGSWWHNLSASLTGGTMHIVVTNQNYGGVSSITCDGVAYAGNAASAKSGTDTFQIFNCFRNNMGACRVYYCKITRGAGLVFDGIPVIDKQGIACMYDKVSGQIFYNAGTGVFTTNEDA